MTSRPGFPRAASARSQWSGPPSAPCSAEILGAVPGALWAGPRSLPHPSSHLPSSLGTLTQQGLGGTLPQILGQLGEVGGERGCWVSAGMKVGSARVHGGAVFQTRAARSPTLGAVPGDGDSPGSAFRVRATQLQTWKEVRPCWRVGVGSRGCDSGGQGSPFWAEGHCSSHHCWLWHRLGGFWGKTSQFGWDSGGRGGRLWSLARLVLGTWLEHAGCS